jgi:hypothetical protein
MFGMLEDGPFVDKFVVLPDNEEPPSTITVRSAPTADKAAPDESHRYRFIGFRGTPNSAAFYVYLPETIDPNEPALPAQDK